MGAPPAASRRPSSPTCRTQRCSSSAADGYKYAFANDNLVWERFSERQATCSNRRKFAGTGTGMGGSGSINGQVYTRGAAMDYDEWPEGWRWNDVVPDFEAVEAKLRPNRRPPTEFTEAVIKGAETAGFRRSEDLNDGDLSGVIGYEWMNYEGDQRRSSYVAFVKDRGERESLRVLTRARVHKIEVDSDRRVSGVTFEHDGVVQTASVAHEVVMCAGALETPKLLMLSGIGPGEVLRQFEIPEVLDAPGVGMHLQDHPNVPLFHVGNQPADCYWPQLYGFHRALPEADHLQAGQSDTCYVGYPACSSLKYMAKRMLPTLAIPQWAYGSASRAVVRGGLNTVFAMPGVNGFIDKLYAVVVILGKPKSRGSLTLGSLDPSKQAVIDPNYYGDEQDLKTMLAGVHRARQIAAGDPLLEWGNKELTPGKGKTTDEQLVKWIGKETMTTFHFVSTCMMGESESFVTDERLHFRGIKGLRIGDASVIPTTPVSALNAPSMMVGYRAARFIREERQG